MVRLFEQIITDFELENNFKLSPQSPDQIRYLNKRDFENLKRIPEDANKVEIDRIARAFWYPPYELAYFETSNGTRVEAIPEIAKNELAYSSHKGGLTDLLQAANISLPNF